MVFSIGAFSALMVGIRALEPERLLNPDAFDSVGDIVSLLSAPTGEFLPSDWCIQILFAALYGSRLESYRPVFLLFLTPCALFFVSAWLHRRFYFRGYSKSKEGKQGHGVTITLFELVNRRSMRRNTWRERASELSTMSKAFDFLRGMFRKDILIFIRDPGQWTQLMVIGAILAIYLVNYKYVEDAAGTALIGDFGLYFINLAACGFVIVAVCGRFLFPIVSLEGRSFWLILQAPISLHRFLLGKWLGGVLQIVVISQMMVWIANLLVYPDAGFAFLASGVVLVMALAISAVAVGMGAIYPQFDKPNAAKIASSFGAVIFMAVSMFMVVFVLAFTFRTLVFLGNWSGDADVGALRQSQIVMGFLGVTLPLVFGAIALHSGAKSLSSKF
jgi:ABC-2 type transport system permease protein